MRNREWGPGSPETAVLGFALVYLGTPGCSDDITTDQVLAGSPVDARRVDDRMEVDAASFDAALGYDASDGAADIDDAGLETWTDARIAAVLRAASKTEIRLGKLAEEKAYAAEVRALASETVIAHQLLLSDLSSVLAAQHIGMHDNALSGWIMRDANARFDELDQETGSNFDREYVASLVTSQLYLVMQIDCQLVKVVMNAELAASIASARATAVTSLSRAEALEPQSPSYQ